MSDDRYEKLAARYDRMLRENPKRDAFFRDLFMKHGVKRVLDCACGTGRDLIAFGTMGFDVEGSDLSEAMLQQARLNLADAKLSAPVRRADFKELDQHFASASFDAVVCLSNSINELLDDTDVVTALRAMRAVLRPGGIVVIDQGQTDASMENPPRYDVVVNELGFTRILVMQYDADLMTVHVVDAVSGTDEATVEDSAVHLKIRRKADWEQLMTNAGFSDAKFLGSWDRHAYDEQAKRMIVIAGR